MAEISRLGGLISTGARDWIDDRILRFIFDFEHKLDFAELSSILRTFVLSIS
jgi:hypothetical protein